MANRGYTEPGKEGLAYSRGDETPPDLFEAFNVGREDAIGPEYDRAREFYAAERVARSAGRAARRRGPSTRRRCAASPTPCCARWRSRSSLPEEWFVAQLERAVLTTRAINYERPAGAPAPLPGQTRMGAHTDYGVLTVLLADDVPGLQVFRAGQWHDVAVPRGTFVCNIGDMLEHWTNDRWTSTLHRVLPPPASVDGPVRRRSIARFLDCPPDLVVSCIPTCAGPDNPARYEPVAAGAWLREKVLSGRGRRTPDLGRGPAMSSAADFADDVAAFARDGLRRARRACTPTPSSTGCRRSSSTCSAGSSRASCPRAAAP